MYFDKLYTFCVQVFKTYIFFFKIKTKSKLFIIKFYLATILMYLLSFQFYDIIILSGGGCFELSYRLLSMPYDLCKILLLHILKWDLDNKHSQTLFNLSFIV